MTFSCESLFGMLFLLTLTLASDCPQLALRPSTAINQTLANKNNSNRFNFDEFPVEHCKKRYKCSTGMIKILARMNILQLFDSMGTGRETRSPTNPCHSVCQRPAKYSKKLKVLINNYWQECKKKRRTFVTNFKILVLELNVVLFFYNYWFDELVRQLHVCTCTGYAFYVDVRFLYKFITVIIL